MAGQPEYFSYPGQEQFHCQVRPGQALPSRPVQVSAMSSLPPPLAGGRPPPSCPQVFPPPPGEGVPLGEEYEHGGVAGLHLRDLLLQTRQVQGVPPPGLLVLLGVVHLLLPEDSSTSLLQELFHWPSLCGPVLKLVCLLVPG